MRHAPAAELPLRTLYAALKLRVDVFVVEQECPYPELDGRDLDAGTVHFWTADPGTPDDPGTSDDVAGYLRLLTDADGTQRIGRLCTAQAVRGHGLGARLMDAALAEVGERACVLDAQEHLRDFYARWGFVPTGPVYDWDGIPHVPMRRET